MILKSKAFNFFKKSKNDVNLNKPKGDTRLPPPGNRKVGNSFRVLGTGEGAALI